MIILKNTIYREVRQINVDIGDVRLFYNKFFQLNTMMSLYMIATSID